jgi:nucleoside-diphosphate-sugar epimerase
MKNVDKTVLLTGITGNLGALMAWNLLSKGCRVLAPCRAVGNITARERAIKTMTVVSGNEIDPGSDLASSLEVIEVDITDSKVMGKLELGQVIDETWHFASTVKFMAKDRDEIYRVNLQGLDEVLALHQRHATPGTRFNYVSTTAVGGKNIKILPEKQLDLKGIQSFHNDYERSKFQAESRLLDAVGKASVNAIVLRPSIVVDPDPPGCLRNFHGYYFLVRSLQNFNRYLAHRKEHVRLRVLMEKGNLVNFIPLDAATQRMLAISEHSPPNGSVFNVCNTSQITVDRSCYELSRHLSHLKFDLVGPESFEIKPKTPYESLVAYNTVYSAPYCQEKIQFDQTETLALLGDSFTREYNADRLYELNQRFFSRRR